MLVQNDHEDHPEQLDDPFVLAQLEDLHQLVEGYVKLEQLAYVQELDELDLVFDEVEDCILSRV